MSGRYVVEKPNEYLWRILDTWTFTWEYVMFSVLKYPNTQYARMWVTAEIADEPGVRAEVEERLADAMLRSGGTPPRVVGHLPPVTMVW